MAERGQTGPGPPKSTPNGPGSAAHSGHAFAWEPPDIRSGAPPGISPRSGPARLFARGGRCEGPRAGPLLLAKRQRQWHHMSCKSWPGAPKRRELPLAPGEVAEGELCKVCGTWGVLHGSSQPAFRPKWAFKARPWTVLRLAGLEADLGKSPPDPPAWAESFQVGFAAKLGGGGQTCHQMRANHGGPPTIGVAIEFVITSGVGWGMVHGLFSAGFQGLRVMSPVPNVYRPVADGGMQRRFSTVLHNATWQSLASDFLRWRAYARSTHTHTPPGHTGNGCAIDIHTHDSQSVYMISAFSQPYQAQAYGLQGQRKCRNMIRLRSRILMSFYAPS